MDPTNQLTCDTYDTQKYVYYYYSLLHSNTVHTYTIDVVYIETTFNPNTYSNL